MMPLNDPSSLNNTYVPLICETLSMNQTDRSLISKRQEFGEKTTNLQDKMVIQNAAARPT